MWTTLAFVTALSLAPGQSGKLELTNVRPTYGLLGPERTGNEFLPGDIFLLTFDIANVKENDLGEVSYSMAMDVVDSKGKSWFKQDPLDRKAQNALGGGRVPAFAHVTLGLDQPPGDYTLRVTVKDGATKSSKTLERKFKVLSPDFGLVRLGLSVDPQGQFAAPPLAVAGQSVWLNFAAVGFERAKAKKSPQPDVLVELRVFDEDGKPTLAKPFTGEVNRDVPENFKLVSMQFVLDLNRPGKYNVELKATDRIAKKTTKVSFPMTVIGPK